jgi:hypothetical protein
MLPTHHQADVEFAPADIGLRVRMVTTISIAVLPIVVAVFVAIGPARDTGERWLVVLVPLISLLVMGGILLGARVRCYRLVGGELRVQRALQTVRFPLGGLLEVVPDREVFRWARKIRGNAGLGAIAGRFRSKRMGTFLTYVTDTEYAVVLRWPDHCLVVSPQQRSLFIEAVRKRAGLSS